MRTYGSDVRQRRMLADIIEDTIGIFQQDASEYAFAGLIGAAAACLSVVVLVAIGGSVAALLVPFFLIGIAVITLATVTEALRRVTDNLEPSAAESLTAVARGLPAILLPWAALAFGLAAALLLDVHFGHYVPSVGRGALELLVIAAALWSALQRVLAVPSLVMRRAPALAAMREGRGLFEHSRGKVTAAWGICMAPTFLVFLIPALSGFGAVSSAIAAFALVGTMPFAAVMNALLFFDGISEDAPAAGESKRAAMARRTTGLRQTR